jgi:hypothetical protein
MTGWRKSSFSGANTNCVQVAWHKSTFSDVNTNCVEVAWRKSSFSDGNTDCVEVGLRRDLVRVRDSKRPGEGLLAVPSSGWRAFLISLDRFRNDTLA